MGQWYQKVIKAVTGLFMWLKRGIYYTEAVVLVLEDPKKVVDGQYSYKVTLAGFNVCLFGLFKWSVKKGSPWYLHLESSIFSKNDILKGI